MKTNVRKIAVFILIAALSLSISYTVNVNFLNLSARRRSIKS